MEDKSKLLSLPKLMNQPFKTHPASSNININKVDAIYFIDLMLKSMVKQGLA